MKFKLRSTSHSHHSFGNKMAKELRARIGSARLLLERLISVPTEHESASRTQCEALVSALFRAKNMTNADKATLAELAQQVQWHPSDATRIADAFSSCMASGESGCHARHKLQDFQNIHHFFLESEWAIMSDSKTTLTFRLELIINRCIALTCRHPTELTYKFMTSMLCVLSEDRDRSREMTASDKTQMMNWVKQHFKSAVRRSGQSLEHIQHLPAGFVELERAWPQVASSLSTICNGNVPCQCPIDESVFINVQQSFGCRSSGKSLAHSLSCQPRTLACTSDSNPVEFMQKFAMMMVQGMARMNNQQNNIFDMIGVPEIAPYQSFHSGAALTMGQNLSSMVPALTNGSQNRSSMVPALTNGSLEIVQLGGDARNVAPEASAFSRALSSDSQSIDSQASAHAEVTLDTAPADLGASDVKPDDITPGLSELHKNAGAIQGTISLMNALDAREMEKVEAKKLQKRPAQLKEDATPKAKAKAKAKTQNAPKQLLESKAKTKAKPKSNGVHTPKKPRKTEKVDARATGASDVNPDDITPEKQPGKRLNKRPHFSLEAHRSQYMCRTGTTGKGSTHAIQFGPTKKFKSQDDALEAAIDWVRQECMARGFECSA